MKALRFIVAAVLALAGVTHAGAQAYGQTPQQTDSLSRAAATIMADNINRSLQGIEGIGVTIDRALFQEALIQALSGGQTGFDPGTANEYIGKAVARVNEFYAKKELAFIDSIQARNNGVVLDGGTVLVVVQEGEGVMPTAADRVKVTYQGRLSDGTVFDQTNDGPVEFDVARLVPGFTIGLEHMKPGGTYRLLIPPSQAYGERGIPGAIPANSALDFTVNLIEIIPPAAAE